MIRDSYEYLEYLSALVGSAPTDILEYLLRSDFSSPVERDGNRSDWALRIREYYMEEEGLEDAPNLGDCSVLELLIHLAQEADLQCSGTQMELGTGGWFWHILGNLGIEPDSALSEVEKKIRKFLRRTYRPNGSGGPFPLTMPPEDIRRMELWDQLSWYVLEVTDLGF